VYREEGSGYNVGRSIIPFDGTTALDTAFEQLQGILLESFTVVTFLLHFYAAHLLVARLIIKTDL
jgi:hypothetical protein